MEAKYMMDPQLYLEVCLLVLENSKTVFQLVKSSIYTRKTGPQSSKLNKFHVT